MDITMRNDELARPGSSSRIEVITGVERRRRWTTAQKVGIVEETMQLGNSVSSVARRHGIAPNMLFASKRRMTEGGTVAAAADEGVAGSSWVRELERQVRDLERFLGRKTMEVEILKEAIGRRRLKSSPASMRRYRRPD
jgi:transposase